MLPSRARSAQTRVVGFLAGDMFERFSDSTRRVLFNAHLAAGQAGSPTIDGEHLLLGLLVKCEDGVDAILAGAGLAPEALRAGLATPVTTEAAGSTELALGEEGQRVLQLAVEEADTLGSDRAGSGHVLLGLIRCHDLPVGQRLHDQGLRLESARACPRLMPPERKSS
ncbi:MAG: Clp protease N-terminal domain-containing protein [Acidobacteriota bacterium]